MMLSAAAALALLLGLTQTTPAPLPAGEVIAAIRVHGNTATPDAEIVEVSGLAAGASFADALLADARRRLEATHRFEHVDVEKRYASITDPSQVIVLIVVDEGPVSVDWSGTHEAATVVRRRGLGRHLMFLPIVDAEDGYGLTYGARMAYVSPAGSRGRLSAPLTWGGTKQAGFEFDRPFNAGPLTRVQAGADVQRRRNPAFDEDDTRRRVWARAERRIGPLRGGVTADRQHVSFADRRDHVTSYGADVTFDTRVDPLFPRNAVDLTAAWIARRITPGGGVVHQTTLDGQGYLGLIGPSVLALRATRESTDAPLPPYFKSLVGGWSNLRGFTAGAFTGDTAVTGSLELRVPLSSPLHVARFGVSAFVDTGTAYDYGARLADQPLHVGIGGGVWWSAAMFHLGVSAAHGRGASTRVNFGGGLEF
jgi:outer membrane protein assembly factor BamA